MERGHVLWTVLILPSSSTVFTQPYPTPLACLAGALVGIWKVRYGACARTRARLLSLRRERCREKTLHPQSERDKCLSAKVNMSATMWAYEAGEEREGELRFPMGD